MDFLLTLTASRSGGLPAVAGDDPTAGHGAAFEELLSMSAERQVSGAETLFTAPSPAMPVCAVVAEGCCDEQVLAPDENIAELDEVPTADHVESISGEAGLMLPQSLEPERQVAADHAPESGLAIIPVHTSQTPDASAAKPETVLAAAETPPKPAHLARTEHVMSDAVSATPAAVVELTDKQPATEKHILGAAQAPSSEPTNRTFWGAASAEAIISRLAVNESDPAPNHRGWEARRSEAFALSRSVEADGPQPSPFRGEARLPATPRSAESDVVSKPLPSGDTAPHTAALPRLIIQTASLTPPQGGQATPENALATTSFVTPQPASLLPLEKLAKPLKPVDAHGYAIPAGDEIKIDVATTVVAPKSKHSITPRAAVNAMSSGQPFESFSHILVGEQESAEAQDLLPHDHALEFSHRQLGGAGGVALDLRPSNHMATATPQRQLAAAISSQDEGKISEITLSPEELGTVKFSVRSSEGSISISIWVERDDTLQLFRRNSEALSEELQNLGLENASFSFEGEQQGSPEQSLLNMNESLHAAEMTANTADDTKPVSRAAKPSTPYINLRF